MVDAFVCLLDAAVSSPATAIAELLVPAPPGVVTHETSAASRPSSAWTVPDAFRRQVAATPDAVALLSGNERWTYAELEARATQLARTLRARGVRQETAVGVCVQRSVDSIVAALGVLQAGGTYVPLDPDYPFDRIEYLAQDAGAPIIVREASSLDRRGVGQRGVICLAAEGALH